MDIDLITHDWEAIAGKRMQFAQAFYHRLFERHPEYRALFPESMDAQMERMVEMFSGITRFADHADVVRPYLVHVGFAHRRLGIGAADVENFRRAFVDTLAHLCEAWWDESHTAAWNDAFDEMILPLFDEGLETGRGAGGGS